MVGLIFRCFEVVRGRENKGLKGMVRALSALRRAGMVE